ncbi:hypothetical protein SELMODRAFT_158748 [Selaginella moellendorffii]|uniref:SNF2 family DNA-dependent ATPase n=2 Tax=Selaginella moellendorffii TaxID=88036 RepID=D8SVR2_SELML|nr:hypothetical protein SELMODRAFT_158748 [Selaginella moellendorffii]
MAGRLRTRSRKKPSYREQEAADSDEIDDDDAAGNAANAADAGEAKQSDDHCSVCSLGGKLLCCDTCTAVYHLECLDPPMKSVPKGDWSCLKCREPLADLEKILDWQIRPPEPSEDGGVAEESTKHYLVKWKSKSYMHCSWVTQAALDKAIKSYPGIRLRLMNFNRQSELKLEDEEEKVPVKPEWTTVDRIIDYRKRSGKDEFLVKWKELGYEECTWETEDDIVAFQAEIKRYKAASTNEEYQDVDHDKRRQKAFTPYDKTPEFVVGGVLHPYQLEGLNFLRYAWQQGKPVILADEMGLGKTIQTISFLTSLLHEGVSLPHLIVAPLSTLRNWEREFSIWAPQMSIVTYIGSAQAREIIRQKEFFLPKERKPEKGKKNASRQRRVKFNVLLTSYEMVNTDSAVLKPIKWECLIVDEGHRLKNKDSKLFQTLHNYSTYSRVLLTGTPLQNNLDELFTLMYFLDSSKFSSLEEFQLEFKDINHEEQVQRLHTMLSSHLLRRVKKDVLKELPPKKELIVRVELSAIQKDYYRAVLTRNYEVLSRHSGVQVSLNNLVMELRKICAHPFLLDGVEEETEDEDAVQKTLVEASGKLLLLDKMTTKLKAEGHRVLIYSQFQRVLDILEDWLAYKNWNYERIDGKVSGADRQSRIDRFNAPGSKIFCFLLSTRAGGLGINLATADTVVIYDSDWNPHADMQAMARAHRMGQTSKVMIYRLITRGTIEERMMQLSKKKMVLEHLVVGRMKTQILNQEELDDILRYGAKELFADETAEEAKLRQIHYDDSAIDRLLDRSLLEETEELDEDNSFFKAFKVANFEYVNQGDAKAAEAIEQEKEAEADFESQTMDPSARTTYWENLLKNKYEARAREELGKGKRSRKQVNHFPAEDDLAGMSDTSSEEEDDNKPEAEVSKDAAKRTPGSRKKPRGMHLDRKDFDFISCLCPSVEATGPPPLMEGEGKSILILGFNRKQRAMFVQVLMRFGFGDFSWSEFVSCFKHKTVDEIKEYAALFLMHVTEEQTDIPTFSDGIPKEGLRIQDVFVRLAILHLIWEKVKNLNENPSTSLFPSVAYNKYAALKETKVWKEEQDRKLLKGIVKHGYGRWQAICEDEEYGLQPVLFQELFSSIPNSNSSAPATTDLNQDAGVEAIPLQPENKNLTGDKQEDAAKPSDPHSDEHRDAMDAQLQRKTMEFFRKRILVLEKVLNAEYHDELLDQEQGAAEGDQEGLEDETKLYISQVYSEMTLLVADSEIDAVQAYAGNKSAGSRLRRSIRQLEGLCMELETALYQRCATGSDENDPSPS